MGATLTGTATTVALFASAIKSVLAADGWTFDLDTASRIHIHKGDYHFDLSFGSTSSITGCTGYASGQTAENQPNAKSVSVNYFALDGYPTSYFMVSTGNSFYCASANIQGWGYRIFWGFGVVENKVGTWDGGQFVHGTASGKSTTPFVVGANMAVRVNESWVPNATYGALEGSYESSGLRSKMPFGYNAGMLLLPLDIYCKNIGNSTLLHPLGEAPNLFMARGGDVYAIGDTVNFSGSDYLAMPENSHDATVATLMVKLV